MSEKIGYLVVDTSAFIKNVNLDELGENILTVEEVVNEIRNKRQLKQLAVLPYDLKIEPVQSEYRKFVTEAAKKIGEFRTLSKTDLNVIALTYQLEMMYATSTDHLKSLEELDQLKMPINKSKKSTELTSDSSRPAVDSFEQLNKSLKNVTRNDAKFEEVKDEKMEICEEKEQVGDGEEDEEGWITAENIEEVKQKLSGTETIGKEQRIEVACLTTDYAMQNLLKQIGLNVISLDGKLIRNLRTYIFRCHGCFRTTSDMTKQFCPHCGNKTLKKVQVQINEKGEQQLRINYRHKLVKRGVSNDVLVPKGGKHGCMPIVCEDIRLPEQRPTRASLAKNSLSDDYIAGYSPFVTHQTRSKAAALGFTTKSHLKRCGY